MFMNETKLQAPYLEGGPSDAPPPYSAAMGASAPPNAPPYGPEQEREPRPYSFVPPGHPHQQHPIYMQQAPQQVIVHVIQNPNLYTSPARIICQFCQADILTRVTSRYGIMAHLMALFLCFFCCPLFWIPYMFDSMKIVTHECPNCERFLGEYRPEDWRRRHW